jgi:hypothetical protein
MRRPRLESRLLLGFQYFSVALQRTLKVVCMRYTSLVSINTGL